LLSRDASPRSGIRAVFLVLCAQLSIQSWLGLFEQHPRLGKWRVCRV
jgi:hypothetical protein